MSGEDGGQGFSGGTEGGQGGNPAWGEMLSAIPQEYHSAVTPHLQNWDRGVQERFQKVHSSYEPYKEFVDNQIPPDHIRVAMGLAQALEESPEQVYQALHEQFGQQQMNGNGADPAAGAQFGGEEQGESGAEYSQLPPEFMQQYQTMEQQVNTMRDIMLQQKEQQDKAREDEELDIMYQQMSKENPVFAELNKDGAAEPYINSLLMAGLNQKDALDRFLSFVDSVGSYHNRPKPPQIMGAGGFMPEQTVRPRDLSDQQRKAMMVQMLKAAHHQD